MISPPDPPLQAGRIRLRLWGPSDLGMLMRAAEDAQIRRGSSLRAEDMPASAERWLAKREAMRLNGTGLSLAIEDAAQPGPSIGCVAFNGVDLCHRRALIGCWLVAPERRRGRGPAAVALLCNWGLESLGLVEVGALVEPENHTSRAMLSSLGFSDDGLQKGAHRIEGVRHDMRVFRRRRTDGPVRLAHRCTAVVLAAGKGVRMGGVTPKPLRAVGGRRMLDWVLGTAMSATGRPCVVVAPSGDSTVARYARQRGCEVVAQGHPTGTAHALLSALDATRADERADMVLVLNADVPFLRLESVRRLMDACTATSGGLGSVLSFTPRCSWGYGRIVRRPDGRMTGLAEPEAPFGPAESATGAYCLNSRGLRARLRSIPAMQGEYHLGLVADGHETGLDVVHVNDPDEGLGANTEEELACLERISRAHHTTGS